MSHKALELQKIGQPLCLVDKKLAQPKPTEVIIRNHAIAINPVDWKMQDSGYFTEKLPTILGSDVAGVVESVGAEVKRFKPGDRVGGYAHVLITKDPRNGAFQDYSAVDDSGTFKIPDDLPFEEASVFPMAVGTAGNGMFLDLNIPRPPAKQIGGFLVWSGASSVGSLVVQTARACGYKVYTTASTHHHDYLKTLGASAVFDYKDTDVVDKIIEAAKANGDAINIGYDAVSDHGSGPLAAGVLEGFGGGKLCTVLPFPGDAKQPANVTTYHTFAERCVSDRKDIGTWLFGEFLAEALSNKTIVPSPEIRLVDGGLEEGIPKAIELSRQGVSGKKLVVKV